MAHAGLVGWASAHAVWPVHYGFLFEVFPGIIIYEVDAAVARVFAREESPSRTGQGDG